MIQQQIKDIASNSGDFAAVEREKAANLDTQFTTSIEQISLQLVEQEESLASQDAENKELQDKLNQFEEHIALRSQHYAAQLKAKDLELQLEEAKHAQKQHLNQQESNKNENMSTKMLSVQASNEEMKSQLALYADKFVMFEDALTRSSGMFEQFEQKIANLDATIDKMTQEQQLRREMCCKLDLRLFDLLDERARPGKEVAGAQTKKAGLQEQCRALQQTRADLIKRRQEAENMM
jgi:chromosome segregation ATPase